MKVNLPPGRYVIAVSGGVDSVVLLHLLAKNTTNDERPLGHNLTVAHFDHGIRPDSSSDRMFVQKLAKDYELPFVFDRAKLGSGASEEEARFARYSFLERVLKASAASAVITAHHQDDVLETAILNLYRGTGRKGLTSLANRTNILRPLLEVPKRDIIAYATRHKLQWQEDSTNTDQRYRRNYVRYNVMPLLDESSRQELTNVIEDQRIINKKIDDAIAEQLDRQTIKGHIGRKYFNQLPHDVSKEILASWLREQGVRGFDARTLERLTVSAKTAKAGKKLEVLNGRFIVVGKDDLALTIVER
jgi:tRNA(Ile)-lysidine synthase